MANILGHRQPAPHGGVLAPVVIVAHENNLLIVRVQLRIRAGPYDVFAGVVEDGDRVAVVARDDGVNPRLLRDGRAGEEVQHPQGVHSHAVFPQRGLDDERLLVDGLDGADVGAVVAAGGVADLNADFQRRLHVFSGEGRAVGPLRGVLDLHGQLGHRLVPGVVAVGKQRPERTVHKIEHVQRLEHQRAIAAGIAGDRHGVVLVGADNVPAVHRAPLLSGEVQGFVARQFHNGFRACAQTHGHNHDQREEERSEFLHERLPSLSIFYLFSRPACIEAGKNPVP